MENIATTDQTITLMTMHAAKGLEFDYIFLAGWEEGVFPSQRSIEELGKKGLEEERRLAYVALTRARKKISITYVNQNRYSYASHDFNKPSRFITEFPKDLIELNDSSFFKQNNFLDDFVQLENIPRDFLTPGRKRFLEKPKKEEIDWDINQDINFNNMPKKATKYFIRNMGMETFCLLKAIRLKLVLINLLIKKYF